MWLLINISDDVYINMVVKNEYTAKDVIAVHNALMGTVLIDDCRERKFERIVVEYPPEDLCTYPKYKGKPYFSIQYEENGEHIVGFGTYNPEVLSRYLIEHFIMPKVSDCRKSERQKAIAEVLEILDEVSSDSSAGGEYWNSAKTITVLRRRIITLKEGEQE